MILIDRTYKDRKGFGDKPLREYRVFDDCAEKDLYAMQAYLDRVANDSINIEIKRI